MYPERQHQDDPGIEPDIRPHLRALEGGGETTERSRGHLRAAPDTPSASSASGSGLRAIDGGGETTERGRDHLQAVKDGEENPMNFTGGKHAGSKRKVKGKGWWNRKRAGIAGGIAGTGLLGGILGLSLVSGPLEFIHLAETLHDAHFSQQENAGDSRMGKLYRYLSSGKRVGATRLGYLSNKYHSRIISKLGEIGITPEYGSLDTYKGFSIDTEHENSPYKGMTAEEAAAAFEEKTGIKPDIKGNKLTVSADKYWAQRKSLNAALSELGDSKVTTAVRSRILGKFGFVTWHPLEIIDKKINNTAAKVGKFLKDKWQSHLKDGTELKVEADTSKASDGEDKNGKSIPASEQEKALAASTASDAAKSKSVLQGLADSKGASVAGGLAAAAGVSCALKAVNDNVGKIRYAQVIVPLIRMGMDTITVGNQVMSGQDVDMTELSYLSQNFNNVNSKGKITDSWNDALPIRSETGQTGGIDSLKANGTRDLITQSSISWLNWTEHLGPICSTAGQFITGVISIGIGILSGGVASTFGGLALGAVLTGPIINKASDLLAGDAVNVLAKGAEWGSDVDYGSRLGANAAALQFGGVALSGQQAALVDAQTEEQQQSTFRSESFFARTLDLYNYQSLLSRFADTVNTNFSMNMSGLFTTLSDAGSAVLRLPFNLYSSTVHAAPKPYDYGFPQYGYSTSDLNNPLVANPYANADAAAKILAGSNGQKYIDKAMKCFGVQLTKGAEGWDAIPKQDVNMYDTKSYSSSSCADSGNTDWLRIRFFIFDTGVMEGYACNDLNDEESCANDGVTDASSSDTSSQTSTTPGTYKNPLRDLKNIVPERIDGGVDYNANDGPIYAVGDGKVVGVRTGSSSGWPGNPGLYLLYKLTDGPAQGKYVYMAEDCTPTVKVGDTLTADTKICDYHYSGTAMEMGWGDGTYNYLTTDYDSHGGGSYASNSGQDFSKFLVSLGAPPGKIEGTKSTVPMPAGWPTW